MNGEKSKDLIDKASFNSSMKMGNSAIGKAGEQILSSSNKKTPIMRPDFK
jgi:hypothetical protein